MVDRIRELLNARQLTPTQFADTIQVSRPVISHILSGRNKPSLEVVQKIVAAFPEVSLVWLLNGTGTMLAEAEVATKPRVVKPAVSAATESPVEARKKAPVASSPPPPATQPEQDASVAAERPITSPLPTAAVLAPGMPPVVLPKPHTAPAPDMLAGMLAPGKSIRRIVIFYQDGTFADYQPEASAG